MINFICREYILQEMETMPDYMFKRTFRCTRFVFDDLYRKLETNFIPVHEGKARYNPISLKHRLGVFLRYVGGGLPEDICLAFGISMSSLWLSLDIVGTLIDDYFVIRYRHEDIEWLHEQAMAFDRYFPGKMFGATQAVDGMFIYSSKPPIGFTGRDNNYFSYNHRSYGMIAIASKFIHYLYHIYRERGILCSTCDLDTAPSERTQMFKYDRDIERGREREIYIYYNINDDII